MKHLFLISIFSLMLFTGTGEAADSLEQKSDNPFRFMIKAGLGIGRYGPNENTEIASGNFVVGIHTNYGLFHFSTKLGSALRTLNEPNASIKTFALNYGFQYQTGVLYLSSTVGGGIIEGTVYGKLLRRKWGLLYQGGYYESINFSTFCIPLKAELGLKFGVFLMSLTYEFIVTEQFQPSEDIHLSFGLLF